MTNPIILTGLRANNDLTIGNYFGGMLPMIDMAKTRSSDYQINMFIPDLHSFTTPINHSELYEQILHNARLFVAAGLPLDNDNIHLYRQSYVPAHSELTWILDCFTGFGEMSRMTQFKEKSKLSNQELDSSVRNLLEDLKAHNDSLDRVEDGDDEFELIKKVFGEQVSKKLNEHSSVGLFNYPVLMAADILLYGAQYVPVGDDQTQHLEFARDIAERMNSRFSEKLFIVPEPVAKQHEFFGSSRASEEKNHQGLRIKDLIDPTKKMSKSDDTGKGVIFLGDDPDIAAKKIMSATTDDKAQVQLDTKEQPGISNLLEILALLRGESIHSIAKQFAGETRYGDFKKVVADETASFLTDFQLKLARVNDTAVYAKLETSEAAMRQQANTTLLHVQQAVGLRPRP